MLGAPKGRRDHYLPQGYLRGFIDPARRNKPQPLWKLDIASKRWAERSTRQVGHSRGFYDYVGTTPELDSLPSSDETFSELENQFPAVLEKLLSLKKRKFRNWTKHLRFLLRYMDMLRARSPLYFMHSEVQWKATPTWTVEEVIDAKTIKLVSVEPSPPSDAFIQNRTIFEMREEIQKSGAWLRELNWALRFTESVTEPFVITETPFVAEGLPGLSEAEALKHANTLFCFPVCWQVCLFGSRKRFDRGTDKFNCHDMRLAREKHRLFAQDFLISPVKLDDITDLEDPASASVPP